MSPGVSNETQRAVIDDAREELSRLLGKRSAWGYRPGGTLASEPTVLACLGLLAAEQEPPSPETVKTVVAAADWLVGIQQPDGAVGVSDLLQKPRWPTNLAALLWANLTSLKPTGSKYAAPLKKATDWLLRTKGRTQARSKLFEHDPTIVGWPWVADTQSWIEPTCMAALALRRQNRGDVARVQEGLRMIRDRALPSGGWNYGNTVVLGSELRPHPAPTGLALLALAGTSNVPPAMINKACDYLLKTLRETKAARTLCWGLLGLRAWGKAPPEFPDWLVESLRQAKRRSDAPLQTAYVLLAAAPRSPQVLGSSSPTDENSP
ncbi:MAG: hypothetical protein N2C14_07715 [Planctomycetales bacterium]